MTSCPTPTATEAAARAQRRLLYKQCPRRVPLRGMRSETKGSAPQWASHRGRASSSPCGRRSRRRRGRTRGGRRRGRRRGRHRCTRGRSRRGRCRYRRTRRRHSRARSRGTRRRRGRARGGRRRGRRRGRGTRRRRGCSRRGRRRHGRARRCHSRACSRRSRRGRGCARGGRRRGRRRGRHRCARRRSRRGRRRHGSTRRRHSRARGRGARRGCGRSRRSATRGRTALLRVGAVLLFVALHEAHGVILHGEGAANARRGVEHHVHPLDLPHARQFGQVHARRAAEGGTERAQVAESHAASLSETVDDLDLECVDHGLHVGRSQGALLLDALDDVHVVVGHRGDELGIVEEFAGFEVLAANDVVG